MGCGKSTVAKELNRQFHMPVVEMDELIVKQEGMLIPEIFSTYGESYFRRLETKLLDGFSSQSGCVISCGGGVAMREENVALMKKHGCIALLTASPETILGRVEHGDDRPLLKGHKNLQDIRNLLNQRLPKYQAAADFAISTDNKAAFLIALEVYQQALIHTL